jgi:hypothetical protein
MEDVKIENLNDVLRRLAALEQKFEKVIIHERESKIEIRYLDVEEACTYMGVKKSSLYKMMKAGRVPFTPHRCPTPLLGGRPGQTHHEVLQEGPTFHSSP